MLLHIFSSHHQYHGNMSFLILDNFLNPKWNNTKIKCLDLVLVILAITFVRQKEGLQTSHCKKKWKFSFSKVEQKNKEIIPCNIEYKSKYIIWEIFNYLARERWKKYSQEYKLLNLQHIQDVL